MCGQPGTHPLKWALPDAYEQLPPPKLLKQLARLSAGHLPAASQINRLLREWLDRLPHAQPDTLLALECLGWCHALPRIGAVVVEPDWRELLQALQETAAAAGGISIHEQPVAHQLLGGELPLTLAYTFPEIKSLKKLRRVGQAALSYGAVELTDGEGLLNARQLARAYELLACWTRCSRMASAAGWKCFDAAARAQYEWTVHQALRLTRADGTLVLSRGLSGDWCSDLWTAALAETGDKVDGLIAQLLLPNGNGQVSARRYKRLPEPCAYSEWAEVCVMRASWSRKSPQFSCVFADRKMEVELSTGGRVLLSGAADPSLRVDGQLLTPQSEWTELCWFTDEDVDYLELELEYQSGWMVQRQMLLARSDEFLLLADAVIGPAAAVIDLEQSWLLADDITFAAEEATHEGYLKNSRPLGLVLPLALPEWKTDSSHGSLTAHDQRLTLRAQGTMRQRLYAPLFIDLAARRRGAKRTWRQLTVAEKLQIQSPDVAVGYRVQVGSNQWMVYRSLAPRGNRTLLGQNLSQEFVVGRFDMDGCLQELIEVE